MVKTPKISALRDKYKGAQFEKTTKTLFISKTDALEQFEGSRQDFDFFAFEVGLKEIQKGNGRRKFLYADFLSMVEIYTDTVSRTI